MRHLTFVCLLAWGLCFLCCGTDNAKENTNQQAPSASEVQTYRGKKLDRFEVAIVNMEREDSKRLKREGEVLFTGSSSIRLWKTLAMDMHPVPVINRGFGGAMIPEVIHYADRMVFPYKPDLIVFYCGENDIAEGASPTEVFESFKKFDEMVQKRLKGTQLIYISMKPSLARWELWDKYLAGNDLIRSYTESKAHLHYFDSSASMLTKARTPDSTIFVADGLHLNEIGYERWKNGIKPMVEGIYHPVGEEVSE